MWGVSSVGGGVQCRGCPVWGVSSVGGGAQCRGCHVGDGYSVPGEEGGGVQCGCPVWGVSSVGDAQCGGCPVWVGVPSVGGAMWGMDIVCQVRREGVSSVGGGGVPCGGWIVCQVRREGVWVPSVGGVQCRGCPVWGMDSVPDEKGGGVWGVEIVKREGVPFVGMETGVRVREGQVVGWGLRVRVR